MRGIRGELALAADVCGEAVEGVIEHLTEPRELVVGAGDVDALRELAAGDARGGVADGLDRLDGAAGQPPAAEQA